MNSSLVYRAPWGRSLKWVSILASLICLAAVAVCSRRLSHLAGTPGLLVLWTPPLALLGAAFFIIRSYRIEGETLLVDRLLWTTRVPLAGLLSASIELNAMRASIRKCGNGGLYSFTGWYWSRALGHYRAFVTDPTHTVVLRFPTRTIVVSPENADDFVRAIRRRR